MDIPLPWARYLRKPPRRLDIKEVGHFGALRIVYDCYEKKVAADAVDDRVRLTHTHALAHGTFGCSSVATEANCSAVRLTHCFRTATRARACQNS